MWASTGLCSRNAATWAACSGPRIAGSGPSGTASAASSAACADAHHAHAGDHGVDCRVGVTGGQSDDLRPVLAGIGQVVLHELPADPLPAALRVHPHPLQPDLVGRVKDDPVDGNDLAVHLADLEHGPLVGQPLIPHLGDIVTPLPGVGADPLDRRPVIGPRRADDQLTVHRCRVPVDRYGTAQQLPGSRPA